MGVRAIVQPVNGAIGECLIEELRSGAWNEIHWAVAFAKMSGIKHLDKPLRDFSDSGGRSRIIVGRDHDGTSFEAVSQLLAAVGDGELFVASHLGQPKPTFHPKIYVFVRREDSGEVGSALLLSGSANLTEGSLFTNYEFNTVHDVDEGDADGKAMVDDIVGRLEAWASSGLGLSTKVDAQSLLAMHRCGWLPREIFINQLADRERKAMGIGAKEGPRPPRKFKKQKPVRRPPDPDPMGPPAITLPPIPTVEDGPVAANFGEDSAKGAVPGPKHETFYLDTGAGTAKTELYLAKVAMKEDPGFFGLPSDGVFTGRTIPKKSTSEPQPERSPRPIVDLRLVDANGIVVSEYLDHPLKIWQYVYGANANQDIRITVPADLLRALGDENIMVMRTTGIRDGITYQIDFLEKGSEAWSRARERATRAVRNSRRKYGWD